MAVSQSDRYRKWLETLSRGETDLCITYAKSIMWGISNDEPLPVWTKRQHADFMAWCVLNKVVLPGDPVLEG